MSEKAIIKKKAGYNWRILLLAGVAFVVWVGWKYPRTDWSLEASPDDKLTADNARPAEGFGKKIDHVVLISIDTCRADHLGCYGYSRNTSPNIDNIAAEGVRFNYTISSIPITLPSHSTMLTGTIPPYHKVRDNNGYILDESNVTLAEILKENGFATGAVVGAVVLDSDYGLGQGFDTYEDNISSEIKQAIMLGERSAAEVTEIAVDWLESNKDKKMFLFAHYFDPHDAYESHDGYEFQSFPFVKSRVDLYDSEIAYTDAHVGEVIDKLKSLGIYESTLLIITADHGEGLGEHGEVTHAFFMYNGTTHVPLIIRAPGGPKGKVFWEVSGLVDIVPTVCGSLGIAVPERVQGRDVFDKSSFGTAREIYSETLYPSKFELGPLSGLSGDNWKYIHSSKPELFDIATDTGEKKNLFEANKDKAGPMYSALQGLLDEMEETGGIASRFVADAETTKQLESLGYVSQAVNDNLTFKDNKPNARDNVGIFQFHSRFLGLCSNEEFERAKNLALEAMKEWPYQPDIPFFLGMLASNEQDMSAMYNYYRRYILLAEDIYKGRDIFEVPSGRLFNAHANVGVVLAQREDFVKAEEHFKKASIYGPDQVKIFLDLGRCRKTLGDYEGSVESYSHALVNDPTSMEAISSLRQIGKKQIAEVDYQQALKTWTAVTEHRPTDHNAFYNISVAYFGLGEFSKAEGCLIKALKLDGENAVYHNKMAEIMVSQDKNDEAVESWQKALAIEPSWDTVLNNLAWMYCSDKEAKYYQPSKSVEFAQKACDLTKYDNLGHVDTLCSAYAAAGQYAEAIAAAEKILQQAESSGNKDLADSIKKRIQDYKSR